MVVSLNHSTLLPENANVETANRFEPKTFTHSVSVSGITTYPERTRLDYKNRYTLPDSLGYPNTTFDSLFLVDSMYRYYDDHTIEYLPQVSFSYAVAYHFNRWFTLGGAVSAGGITSIPAQFQSIIHPVVGSLNIWTSFGGTLRNHPNLSLTGRIVRSIGIHSSFTRTFTFDSGTNWDGSTYNRASVQDAASTKATNGGELSGAIQYAVTPSLGIFCGSSASANGYVKFYQYGGFSIYKNDMVISAHGGAKKMISNHYSPQFGVEFSISRKHSQKQPKF